jgi:hypothetical protein
MARDRVHDNPWSRLVTGTAILIAGLVFWMDQLDRVDASDYFQWWSVLLIAYGITHLLERKVTSAVLFIIFGVLFLPPVDFFDHFRFSQILAVWPLLISVGGITLVAQALRPKPKDAATRGAFRAIAVMAGNNRTIVAEDSYGGDVVAVMGGCEFDVIGVPAGREVVIDALAFWGGIDIRVPLGWKIEKRVAVILGALEDKTVPPTAADAPRLVIRGSAIMGSIEVRNGKEESS